MSFSIDRILHCPPAKPSPVSVPQLSLEQYCKYWLATSRLSMGGYVMCAPFHSASYPYHKASTLTPVARERDYSVSPSCSESEAEPRTEHMKQLPPKKTSRAARKKKRTIFTTEQLQDLEKHFGAQKYLSKTDRNKVASQLGLKERQVTTWYQNRRTRWKKDCSDKEWSREKEITAASNYSQFVQMKSQSN